MRARIQAAARRLLGIEGQQAQTWKHAVTSNSIMGMRVDKARIPTPPSEPGNWELVTVATRGMDVIFWWKALAEKPPHGEFYDPPIPAPPDEKNHEKRDPSWRPLKDPDPDLVQHR